MEQLSRKFLMLLLSALLVVMTAATAFAADGVDYTTGTITVHGMGVAPARAVNAAQAKMLARRAAVVDGYRQLAEAVKGVNVDAETTVENMMVSNDVVKTHVSAMIQGARVIDEKVVDGMGYEVTMQVSMFGVSSSVASAVIQKPAVLEPFPQPVASVAPTPIAAAPAVTPAQPATSVDVHVTVQPSAPAAAVPSTPAVTAPSVPSAPAVPAAPAKSSAAAAPVGIAAGGYTGLVVDCRGMGLRPVMSPVIKNANGQAIYGYKNLNYDKVVANGMAGYTRDINSVARAGSHPLVVKAVALDNQNGNPVLSVADANRVLIENGATGFLDQTNVVFVR